MIILQIRLHNLDNLLVSEEALKVLNLITDSSN
jgi:hypothetical protein